MIELLLFVAAAAITYLLLSSMSELALLLSAVTRWGRVPSTGAEGMVGASCEVLQVERSADAPPQGKVHLNGERWNARFVGGAAGADAVGKRGVVLRVDGLTLLVHLPEPRGCDAAHAGS